MHGGTCLAQSKTLPSIILSLLTLCPMPVPPKLLWFVVGKEVEISRVPSGMWCALVGVAGGGS